MKFCYPCIINSSFFVWQEEPIEEHNEEIDGLSEKIAALRAWFLFQLAFM